MLWPSALHGVLAVKGCAPRCGAGGLAAVVDP
ncbi:hypothetical protein GGD71_006359 [Variovorax guangxiensis]|uniref:Uncharacterized protein n=1 Tax=Variovorax guangxiensis TaxID=1775474 RepID=A0A840FSF5_9BURK|nr:hypothetical protein [Variovorax guangxiensis]